MKKTLASGASSLLTLLIVVASSAQAQYVISTFAGGVGPPTPAAGTTSSVGAAFSVAADTVGNIYFDSTLACVFKQNPAGIVTRVAGTCHAGYSGDGGPATQAQLGGILRVAVDPAGNLYIADGVNQRVRKVTSDGIINTFAGSGQIVANGGDGGPAVQAQLSSPRAVAFDSAGSIYIGEGGGLRKVLPDGTITSIAKGDIGFPYGIGGVAIDVSGTIFVTEPERDNLRKISPAGATTTLPVGFSYPQGLAVDTAGNLFVADHDNDRIAMVAPSGAVSTVAGACLAVFPSSLCPTGFAGDGGPAVSAVLGLPYGVAVDAAGNVYAADTGNRRIRKISTIGQTRIINTIAGNGTDSYSGDGGPASKAQLGGPSGAAFDSTGNLYFADASNNRIRKIARDGTITTIAGNGSPGFSGDGGPAISAQLNLSNAPDGKVGLAIDPAGNLFVTDAGNQRIRKVSASGAITTAAMTAGLDVAVDSGGNIFVADSDGVHKIASGGVSTFLAQGSGPLALDSAGNLYFSDRSGSNYFIRKLSPSGVQTLVLQTTSGPFMAMAVDSSGGVYFASSARVFKISTAPSLAIAGNGSTGYSGDGGPALNAPLNVSGLAVDAAGSVYIMDAVDNAIRLLTTGPLLSAPAISLVANAEGESPTIAPNTWLEIKGSNLAPAGASRIWTGTDFVNGQMPTELDGVSVTVNGRPAYVYYISATQVNILTPPDPLTGSVQVQSGNNGMTSAAYSAPAQAASPSFFIFNGGPYIAAVHTNGSLIGPTSLYPGSTTPALPGETVLLYANGFGPTNVPVTSGSTTQSGTLSPVPVVKIGGIPAIVSFAGLVAPGEFQFNVTIPVSISDGDQSIAAVYNGFTTQPGKLITIKH